MPSHRLVKKQLGWCDCSLGEGQVECKFLTYTVHAWADELAGKEFHSGSRLMQRWVCCEFSVQPGQKDTDLPMTVSVVLSVDSQPAKI